MQRKQNQKQAKGLKQKKKEKLKNSSNPIFKSKANKTKYKQEDGKQNKNRRKAEK